MLNTKDQSKPAKQRRREKQTKVNVRQLKVQYHHCTFSSYEQVPRILLQGKWLQKAGFTIADEVSVTVLENLLVIGKM
ncbi:MAG: type I toxin-antitoxin system SymE family toxin [Tannerella sp.]|jgi:hypothetical protein|nr:type I toxin-antitoxin system SymE family toxin [Tannerella sp.]